MASLRMAGWLALTDESTVSVGAMRLAMGWSDASDQLAPQAGSAKRSANSLSMKSLMAVAEIEATAGSSCVTPNLAKNAASTAAEAPASKSAIGVTEELMPPKR